MKSNMVTVYVDNTAPGIYTLAQNGTGAGAILHSDYSEVTAASPAMRGETVQMFLTGLGPVTPGVDDGAAAPSSPLSNSVEAADILVFLGSEEADVLYAGLTPGVAGLYQVNFTVPSSGLTNGDADIAFDTDEALNVMSTISLSGFTGRAAQTGSSPRAAMLRNRAVAAGPTFGKHTKNFRRALPER